MTAGTLAAGALRMGLRRRVATLNIQGKLQQSMMGLLLGTDDTSLFLLTLFYLTHAQVWSLTPQPGGYSISLSPNVSPGKRRNGTCPLSCSFPLSFLFPPTTSASPFLPPSLSSFRPGYDAMLVLEHTPVYTLGRSAKPEDVKFSLEEREEGKEERGFEVYKSDRGGQVTWHGPGQIVMYPIIDLTHHKKDLRWYVRGMEEVVLRVLASHGVTGQRDEKHTGVWVEEKGGKGKEGGEGGLIKVAAIGVSASRWITCHGLALNVNPDLKAFDAIVPCGVKDRRVG